MIKLKILLRSFHNSAGGLILGKSIRYIDLGFGKEVFADRHISCYAFGFFCAVCYAQQTTTNQDKAAVALQVARKWINVGVEQYKRGLYGPAEKSFLFANDYKEYLPAAEQDKLNQLLENTRKASAERKKIQEHIDTASQLVKEEKFAEAGQHLRGDQR